MQSAGGRKLAQFQTVRTVTNLLSEGASVANFMCVGDPLNNGVLRINFCVEYIVYQQINYQNVLI